jgi:hypothetical protein
VREEATREPDPAVRASLDGILRHRDTATAGLARGEGSVREVLGPIEVELRRALGYPVPVPGPGDAAPAGPS